MPQLILFTVLLVGILTGLFVGLVICANTEWGDFTFSNLPGDLLRCGILAVVTAGAGVGLFQLAHNARVFIGLVPIYYIGLKLCWLDLKTPEIVVIGLSTFVAMATAIAIAVASLT
jgi:hypothetical protein